MNHSNSGRGHVQQFLDKRIEMQGADWLQNLYDGYGTCEKVADSIFKLWDIKCSGSAVRAYMIRHGMKLNPHGWKSKKARS